MLYARAQPGETRATPVVIVCQSGKRLAMATQILSQAGYDMVANVPGGLLHWERLALPFRE
ncbi:MAG: rhodanese-like domain-containing protein [Pseudomonadales bacterium]|jgi:rhodanese-related sulfurtransferase|nr:rhodanese-like domain-containing protein [Pseudomonadales bacterium]MDP6470502.1 rhodanese-like domain-containing protein [Pseudomonadales bacterium]MDP6827804.1 rhodanese-like domain-containing protein [Pseudomonadales bacterium]MDP6972976.1 rhodanese-like domain-containing protein [Pseudomonadales bacterium]